MNPSIKIIGIAGAAVALLALAAWLVFGGSGEAPAPAPQTFGTGDARVDISNQQPGEATEAQAPAAQSAQSVFKIHDGPIAGAAFVQTLNPTTTIARFVTAHNGRVFDLPLDSPGAVPRTLSNTTIPGIARALWTQGGVVMQYLDQETVKTLALTLPAATTSAQAAPARLAFLPDNVIDLAVSPDGDSLAYALRGSASAEGYVARADGTGARRAFSLALAQILLAWPAPATLMAQAAPAYGIETMAFTVDVASGTVTPLLKAPGLTLSASPGLARALYHTAGGPAGRMSYMRDAATGGSRALSFNPLPEQCIWSRIGTSSAVCAVAASYAPDNYGDLRRSGEASVAQMIVAYGPDGLSTILATPGADGGVASDIAELALSLDERYLLFIKKDDRSLWGVRLF